MLLVVVLIWQLLTFFCFQRQWCPFQLLQTCLVVFPSQLASLFQVILIFPFLSPFLVSLQFPFIVILLSFLPFLALLLPQHPQLYCQLESLTGQFIIVELQMSQTQLNRSLSNLSTANLLFPSRSAFQIALRLEY